jgi:hypothetical protein
MCVTHETNKTLLGNVSFFADAHVEYRSNDPNMKRQKTTGEESTPSDANDSETKLAMLMTTNQNVVHGYYPQMPQQMPPGYLNPYYYGGGGAAAYPYPGYAPPLATPLNDDEAKDANGTTKDTYSKHAMQQHQLLQQQQQQHRLYTPPPYINNNTAFRPGQYPPYFPPPTHPHHPQHPIMMTMMMMPNMVPSSRGISLSLACDLDSLSDYQILVRQQLELFEATAEDVDSNTQGRKKSVALGQIGVRCRHCAGISLRARGRGAVYYPAKLTGIYQAAQNMAASHLCQACQHIPPSIKHELRKYRERKDNASGGKKYWADACRILGVYEAADGLRLEGPSEQRVDETNCTSIAAAAAAVVAKYEEGASNDDNEQIAL